MHTGNVIHILKISRLIIKKNVRLQYLQDTILLNPTHKKDLVHLDPHTQERKNDSLMSRSIACCDEGSLQQSIIRTIFSLPFPLQFLKRRYPLE